MKKTLLSLLLLLALMLSMAVMPQAVSVNQKINYSDSDWGTGKNPESSGLWKYEWRAGETGVISDMRWCAEGYFEAPFTTASASDTHWWCRVRDNGMGMHPGAKADSIKTFICPEDGKVNFRVVLNRQYAVNAGNNGTSVCVYLNDTKIWPTDSDVHELNDALSITISLDLDIKKNDLIRLIVGSLGNSGADGVVLTEHSVKYVSGDNLDPEMKTYKIACVGDSITEGYMTSGGLKGPTAYPAQLQKLLNNIVVANYEVKNFGRSTQTALKTGDYP